MKLTNEQFGNFAKHHAMLREFFAFCAKNHPSVLSEFLLIEKQQEDAFKKFLDASRTVPEEKHG